MLSLTPIESVNVIKLDRLNDMTNSPFWLNPSVDHETMPWVLNLFEILFPITVLLQVMVSPSYTVV